MRICIDLYLPYLKEQNRRFMLRVQGELPPWSMSGRAVRRPRPTPTLDAFCAREHEKVAEEKS